MNPLLTPQFILGPLSLLTAYLTATGNSRRHFLQTVVSVAHLYGVVIYYFSSLADIVLRDQRHCRPEARYVWGYFIGGNIPWLIVPACTSSRHRLPRLLMF
jgi:EXPERA (EXPanded EBP superfamily)